MTTIKVSHEIMEELLGHEDGNLKLIELDDGVRIECGECGVSILEIKEEDDDEA